MIDSGWGGILALLVLLTLCQPSTSQVKDAQEDDKSKEDGNDEI